MTGQNILTKYFVLYGEILMKTKINKPNLNHAEKPHLSN